MGSTVTVAGLPIEDRVVGWKSVSVAGDVPWGSVLGPLMHGQKVDKLLGEIAQNMAMQVD